MEKFYKTNKLGITYDCYVVARTIQNDNSYIIYTDFINNKNDDLRLFVVKVIDDEIFDVSYEESNMIIGEFQKERDKFLKEVRS